MRILIISQWYAPEPDGKVSMLAESLVKKGHSINVITAFPNYPQGKLYEGYRIKWRQWEKRNCVKILRLPVYPDHSRSVIKRSFNYGSFSLSLMALGPLMVVRPDVIWGYTALVGIPSLWFSFLFQTPFVLEIADPWPEALIASGMVKKGFLTKSLEVLLNKVYRRASALTVQHPGFKRNLIAKEIDPGKIYVIENWADSNIYKPLDRDEKLARQYGFYGKFNIVFAGTMGFAQGLETIIQAASILRDIPDIQFIFIGDGSCFTQIKKYSESLGTSNVIYLGRQPKEKMASFFALADGLLVHLRKDPIFEITIPSKTQSYLACSRPIIMALGGDGAQLVQETKCGLTCPPEDSKALANAVLKLKSMSMEERQNMGEAGRQVYLNRFTESVLINKMESILIKAAKDSKEN